MRHHSERRAKVLSRALNGVLSEGVLTRLGVSMLATLLVGLPTFAESGLDAPTPHVPGTPITPTSTLTPVPATDSAQLAAIAFFNRIAQESANPYIMAVARESAARLSGNPHATSLALTTNQPVSPSLGRVEVPVIAQPDNSIAVPVMVNAKTMGTFIIDTGSSYTVITPRLASKLGVEITPDTPRISMITANGVIQAPLVTLNEVVIGRVRVYHVQAVVQDLGKDLMLSGLLGLNFFKGKTLTIRQDKLILEDANDESRLSSR